MTDLDDAVELLIAEHEGVQNRAEHEIDGVCDEVFDDNEALVRSIDWENVKAADVLDHPDFRAAMLAHIDDLKAGFIHLLVGDDDQG